MKFSLALIGLLCVISLVKSASLVANEEITVVDKNVPDTNPTNAFHVANIINVPCKAGYVSVNGVCVEIADD